MFISPSIMGSKHDPNSAPCRHVHTSHLNWGSSTGSLTVPVRLMEAITIAFLATTLDDGYICQAKRKKKDKKKEPYQALSHSSGWMLS